LWPASVPAWLHELWWAELVNVPDGSPADLFKEASDVLFHGSVVKSEPVYDRSKKVYLDRGIVPMSPRRVQERLDLERRFGSFREPRKNIHGEYR